MSYYQYGDRRFKGAVYFDGETYGLKFEGAGGSTSLKIGNSTQADSSYTIALGQSARATQGNAIALGGSSYAQYAITLGHGTNQGYGAICIGESTSIPGSTYYGICIGYDSRAQYSNAIGIGRGCYGNNQFAIAMGDGCYANGQYSIAIGTSADSNQDNSICIGRASRANTLNSIAVGYNASIPTDATYPSTNAIAIGGSAVIDLRSVGSIVIGNGANTDDNGFSWNTEYSVVIGASARSRGIRAVAVGYNTQGLADYSVAIGTGATTPHPTNPTTTSSDSIAIGYGAAIGTTSTDSIAIGTSATTSSSYWGASNDTIAIGHNALGGGPYCVCIGYGASIKHANGVAIGRIATINQNYSNCIAIGYNAIINGDIGIAVGSSAYVGGSHGIAIGYNTNASYANSIAIGEGAVTTAINTGEFGSSGKPVTFKGYADLDWPNLGMSLGPWIQDNVAASQTNVALGLGISTRTEKIAVRSGSILGIVVRSNEARTVGTLTVEVTINGVGTGLTAVLDGTNTLFKATTQNKDLDTFTAGDKIGIMITTSNDWAPTTADIDVEVLVEQ